MKLPASDGIGLILYALDKENDEKLFQRWIESAQYEMSFEEFKQRLKPAQFKSDEEVFADVENILNTMR